MYNKLQNVLQTVLVVAINTLLNNASAEELSNKSHSNSAAAPVLRFCYEDKQLLPYYAGDSLAIPATPGATIEHLQLATARTGLMLQLLRLPWLRCLQQLEENNVDALVAAYVPERDHFTVYPTLANGEPDPTKAINQLGLCLAHRFDNPLAEKIARPDDSITLARPLGYRPIPLPANTVQVGAHSPDQALDLVIEGRVDATTVLCQLNGIAAKERHLNMMPVQLMYPPLHQSSGYLMLSKSFYQRYPQLSEQLWQALPQTLDKARYLQYLQYPY
jgi:polar amino acid transport system substrate-binding protein